jgi:hypothetical protein
MNDHKGIVGAAVTATGGVMSWLPMVNEIIQIAAGIVAITVGIVTIRHYHRKDNRL